MIEVRCICGRKYTVPPASAGRKLQCRRCGAVQRIRKAATPDSDDDGPLIVPWQVPDDSVDGELDTGELALPKSPPLDLKSPMRRCPSCGFNDESTVVVCVRCGYDWRSGQRLEDAHEAQERSSRHRVLDSAEDSLGELSRLAWLSMLTPLGLVLGPYVFARSTASERQMRAYGGGDPGRLQQAQQMRVMAGAGAMLWVALGAFVAFALSGRSGDHVRLSVDCRGRLEKVGRAIRSRLGDTPFPAEGTFREAVRGLARQELEPDDLRCPLSRNLFAFEVREQAAVTPKTEGGFVLLWDREPHADELGKLVFRALRCDGTVEVFRTQTDLQAALQRPPFAGAPPVEPTAVSPPPGEGPATPVTPKGMAWKRQEAGFLKFARRCDEIDPKLHVDLKVERSRFLERVGVPPEHIMPLVLRRKSLKVRRAAARMLARLELPKAQKRRLANVLGQSKDGELRYAGAHALRRVGDKGWLPLMVDVLWTGSEAVREAATVVVGQEAIKGERGTRRVLYEAGLLRRRMNVSGDDAMFKLPPESFKHVVPLLADRKVQREAHAVLYSGGKPGVLALRGALKSTDRKLRLQALLVFDDLRKLGTVPLSEFLGAVGQELDDGVQQQALKALRDARGEPPEELVDWVLGVLRGTKRGPGLKDTCLRILERIKPAGTAASGAGSLKQLVKDLSKSGDHEAVLKELAADHRILDARLDRLLLAQWPHVRDAATRKRLVKIVARQPQEEALAVLLRAVEDSESAVRVAALEALEQGSAVESERFRRDAARLIGKRLRKEKDPLARGHLLGLAAGGYYCSKFSEQGPAQHVCTGPLQRSLMSLTRKGDEAALRCLVTHPSRSVVEFLVGLLSRSKEPYKSTVMLELRGVSGLGLMSLKPKVWRKELGAKSAAVKAHLQERAEAQRKAWRERQRRARHRLAQLKGG